MLALKETSGTVQSVCLRVNSQSNPKEHASSFDIVASLLQEGEQEIGSRIFRLGLPQRVDVHLARYIQSSVFYFVSSREMQG